MESTLLGGKPVNMSTLTDISAFLAEQNTKLEGQITQSEASLNVLTSDLDVLLTQINGEKKFKSIESRINCVKETTQDVKRQQAQSTQYL